MKKSWGLAAVLVLACCALYFFVSSKNAKPEDGASSIQNPSSRPPAISSTVSPRTDTSVLSTTITVSNSSGTNFSSTRPASVPPGPDEPVPTPLPPETVLQNVRRSVRLYDEMFGGNPVGTNPEITRQLNGGNPKHVHFIDASAGMRINERGEMIDSWGTPYFFHQLSGTEMEIHSAGPDKRMWTSDDIVVK